MYASIHPNHTAVLTINTDLHHGTMAIILRDNTESRSEVTIFATRQQFAEWARRILREIEPAALATEWPDPTDINDPTEIMNTEEYLAHVASEKESV